MKASEYIHVALHPRTHRKLLKVQRELQKNAVGKVGKAETVDNVLNFYLEVE